MKWLSERIAKERKIVEDAFGQESRKENRQQEEAARVNNSGESCSSAKKARK